MGLMCEKLPNFCHRYGQTKAVLEYSAVCYVSFLLTSLSQICNTVWQ